MILNTLLLAIVTLVWISRFYTIYTIVNLNNHTEVKSRKYLFLTYNLRLVEIYVLPRAVSYI